LHRFRDDALYSVLRGRDPALRDEARGIVNCCDTIEAWATEVQRFNDAMADSSAGEKQ